MTAKIIFGYWFNWKKVDFGLSPKSTLLDRFIFYKPIEESFTNIISEYNLDKLNTQIKTKKQSSILLLLLLLK